VHDLARVMWSLRKDLTSYHLFDEVQRLTMPTLVMYGERDPNIEVRDAGNFFAGLATLDKQLVVFPGADHCAHLENTHDAWVSAVVTFLNRYAVSGR